MKEERKMKKEREKKRIRRKDAQGKKKEETPCIDVLTTLKRL